MMFEKLYGKERDIIVGLTNVPDVDAPNYLLEKYGDFYAIMDELNSLKTRGYIKYLFNILGELNDFKVLTKGRYYLEMEADSLPTTNNSVENKKMTNTTIKIFLSYCSYDHDLADRVDAELCARATNVIISRYTRDVKYRGSFKEFMQGIGEHDYVISIISDNYLKSYACMYEAGEIVSDKNFQRKLIFIVVSDEDKQYYSAIHNESISAKIYNAINRAEYIQYWEREYNKHIVAFDQIESPSAKIELTEELRRMRRIIDNDLGVFLKYIADARGLSFDEMVKTDFASIFEIIASEVEINVVDTHVEDIAKPSEMKQTQSSLARASQINALADQVRKISLNQDGEFDILKFFEHGPFVNKTSLVVLSDSEMNHARTTTYCYNGGQVIMISESIYKAAAEGDVKAKFILAHELGHLLLHAKNDGVYLAHGESMETDADLFASELLKKQEVPKLNNKYVEQAKKMILDRYKDSQARIDTMIMTQELIGMKMECRNPKVADAISPAIEELIRDGLVRESGLGIHLTQKGYDLIWE